MNLQNNWYKSFFKGLALELWEMAVPDEVTEKELDFIVKQAKLKPKAEVLDVPCGFGRHTIPLAAQGYRVTGIDIASPYVRQVNTEANRNSLTVEAIHADILEYDLVSGHFDAAVCMGNSFSYFPYVGMLAFATKVCKSLKQGGRFIVNTGSLAESILPNLQAHEQMQIGHIQFILDNEYLADDSVLKTNMRFRRVAVYSEVRLTPFNLGEPEAYFVAEK